jgi:chromosome segregation ATPase
MDETRILEAISTLGKRFDGLETRFDGLETRFDGLETRFDGLGTRLDGQERRSVGLESRFDGLERKYDEKTAELHRHFDVVSESLHADVRLVAEGIAALSERQDRFELEVRRDFVATRALLEPPARNIDRRVSHLEEDVEDLRGRVGRLEGGGS